MQRQPIPVCVPASLGIHLHLHTGVRVCLCKPSSVLAHLGPMLRCSPGLSGPASTLPLPSAVEILRRVLFGALVQPLQNPGSKALSPTWVLTPGNGPRPAPLPQPRVASAHHGRLTGWHFLSCLVFFPPCHVDKHNRVP